MYGEYNRAVDEHVYICVEDNNGYCLIIYLLQNLKDI